MGNTKNKILICGGLLLIAAALCLAGYNLWDARRATDSVAELIQELEAQMDSITESQPPAVPDQPEQETLAYLLDPNMDMPTIELDGHEYIGTLEIPSLELFLPVMSEWSYPGLKLSPCRYQGSAYLDNLIICAHNYDAHFGRLKELEPGDTVVFTDTAGNPFPYSVKETEVLEPTDIEKMESGEWDLTMSTCTIGGEKRITVRCEKQETVGEEPN